MKADIHFSARVAVTTTLNYSSQPYCDIRFQITETLHHPYLGSGEVLTQEEGKLVIKMK